MFMLGFLCSQGAEIRPNFQLDLGDSFPNYEKKIPIIFFWGGERLEFSINTHTRYVVTFSFNLMAIVWVKANVFFTDQQ